MAWDEEQEAEAKQKTIEQTQNKVPDDKQGKFARNHLLCKFCSQFLLCNLLHTSLKH